MRQELTAEVAAAQQAVWDALAGELDSRGTHVAILVQRMPKELSLVVNAGVGERFALAYRLEALDAENTAVIASIEPTGPRYALKRLLSFGAVDRGYLDALAVGLANLQAHLDAEAPSAGEKEREAP